MARPVGVTIIAIFNSVAVIFAVITEIGAVRGLIPLTRIGPNFGPLSGMAAIVAALIVDGIVSFAAHIIAIWGLWKLKNWARILTIVLSLVGLAFQLLRWGLTVDFAVSSPRSLAVTLGVHVIIILYLLKPTVRAAFSANRDVQTVPSTVPSALP